ncbi:putative Transposon TX1 [Gossypium australe]|uniref:Putative Transposon TX1 n=1 Tax=Gossypium australe TaxID=47621 RepID=A0A5B6WXH8_9ROSI|nr:putative Transposon TX1 [Gossypium australe]
MDRVAGRKKLEERLLELYDLGPEDDVLAAITNIHLGINLETNKKELFWEQQARVNWLKNGDRNTSFFHKVAVGRQHKNRIHGLKNGDGSGSIMERRYCILYWSFQEIVHRIGDK